MAKYSIAKYVRQPFMGKAVIFITELPVAAKGLKADF